LNKIKNIRKGVNSVERASVNKSEIGKKIKWDKHRLVSPKEYKTNETNLDLINVDDDNYYLMIK